MYSDKSYSFRRYFQNRCARILPLYYLVQIITEIQLKGKFNQYGMTKLVSECLDVEYLQTTYSSE